MLTVYAVRMSLVLRIIGEVEINEAEEDLERFRMQPRSFAMSTILRCASCDSLMIACGVVFVSAATIDAAVSSPGVALSCSMSM